MSVASASVARRFEGGTDPVRHRLDALAQLAQAGYPVGLTIAPIMPLGDWHSEYGELLDDTAATVRHVPELHPTVECITHRFTPRSKDTLAAWYPRTKLDMDETSRRVKRGRYGSVKHVYPTAVMNELRQWFESNLLLRLPQARKLYWR